MSITPKKYNNKILIYDDSCKLCTIAATNMVASSKGGKDIKLIKASSKEAEKLSKRFNLRINKSAYFLNDHTVFSGENAVLQTLKHMGIFWRAMAISIEFIIPKIVLNKAYKFISKHRKIVNSFNF